MSRYVIKGTHIWQAIALVIMLYHKVIFTKIIFVETVKKRCVLVKIVLFIATARCTWRLRIGSVCCFTKTNRGRKIATGLQFLLCKSHRLGTY